MTSLFAFVFPLETEPSLATLMENFNDRMLDVVNLVSKTDKYTTMTKVRTEPVLATVIQLMRQSAVEYGGFTEERAEAEVEAWIAAPGVKFGLETTRSRVDAGSLFSPDVEIKHFEEPREEMLPKFENAMKCWQNCQHDVARGTGVPFAKGTHHLCSRPRASPHGDQSLSANLAINPFDKEANLIMPMNQSSSVPRITPSSRCISSAWAAGCATKWCTWIRPTSKSTWRRPARVFTHSELMATGHYALEDARASGDVLQLEAGLQRLAQQVLSPSEKAFFFPIAEGKPGALGRGHGDSPTNVTLAGTTAVLPVPAVVP